VLQVPFRHELPSGLRWSAMATRSLGA